jgi:beta-glucanase (GH16 family)
MNNIRISRSFAPVLAAVVLSAISLSARAATNPVMNLATAVEVINTTESNVFCQLQGSTNMIAGFTNIGMPVKGSGQDSRTLFSTYNVSNQFFRVVALTNQWTLVWADEFNGPTFDYTKWGFEENGYGGGNNESQFYSTNPKYCYVTNGTLVIAVYKDPSTTTDGATHPYTSARIRTLHLADWTYGRFEIRAKMPSGQGIWPAIWMMPTDSKYGGWAACGEIDIAESLGSNTFATLGTIHYGGSWPSNTSRGTTYVIPSGNSADGFHTYALEWYTNQLKWSYDGYCYQTLSSNQWWTAATNKPGAPFDKPFHMILNVAVNGGFFNGSGQSADNLPTNAFPQKLEVDYVRVYEWSP